MCKKDLPLETCRPQNGRNRVYGVENGRFYITDGDDSFIITEAAASDCRLRRIGNNIGVHFSTAELAYWMVVGNCGHSIGGHHGRGVIERSEWRIFYCGTKYRQTTTELVVATSIAPLSPYGPNSDCTLGIVCRITCVPP